MYVHAELGFFLNGRLLPNNSIVLFTDIGEDSSALFCLTDKVQCCSGATGKRLGVWRLPQGSNVSSEGGVYIRRGFSSIRLNRRSAMMPTGVYMCVIPNSEDSNSILQIGLVSQSEF